MTLKIDFDHQKQQQLLQHIQWLIEIGLIKSYQIDSKKAIAPSSTNEFVEEMIRKAKKTLPIGIPIHKEK